MNAKEMRQKALATRPASAPTLAATIDGVPFFVRLATVRERGEILKAAGVGPEGKVESFGALQVHAVLLLTCTETGERVFEPADLPALLEEPVGGYVDQIGPKAIQMINADPAEVAKN